MPILHRCSRILTGAPNVKDSRPVHRRVRRHMHAHAGKAQQGLPLGEQLMKAALRLAKAVVGEDY
jgi:hypothetical protein